jgi:hypothetical protein
MRLTYVGCEENCLGDDTKRLIVEASGLNVEARHPKVGAARLADEAKHINVEAPSLIVELNRPQASSP